MCSAYYRVQGCDDVAVLLSANGLPPHQSVYQIGSRNNYCGSVQSPLHLHTAYPNYAAYYHHPAASAAANINGLSHISPHPSSSFSPVSYGSSSGSVGSRKQQVRHTRSYSLYIILYYIYAVYGSNTIRYAFVCIHSVCVLVLLFCEWLSQQPLQCCSYYFMAY